MIKKIYCFILITLLVASLIPISVISQKIIPKNDLNSLFFNNSPPYPPNITVPDKIITGKWFKIEVSLSDPDGDNVYIRFNASILPNLPDYWFGPIPSGTVFKAWVKYKGPTGSYSIGVQAKDIYDAESEWTYVKINIYKNKAINTLFFNFFNMVISNFSPKNSIIFDTRAKNMDLIS